MQRSGSSVMHRVQIACLLTNEHRCYYLVLGPPSAAGRAVALALCLSSPAAIYQMPPGITSNHSVNIVLETASNSTLLVTVPTHPLPPTRQPPPTKESLLVLLRLKDRSPGLPLSVVQRWERHRRGIYPPSAETLHRRQPTFCHYSIAVNIICQTSYISCKRPVDSSALTQACGRLQQPSRLVPIFSAVLVPIPYVVAAATTSPSEQRYKQHRRLSLPGAP